MCADDAVVTDHQGLKSTLSDGYGPWPVVTLRSGGGASRPVVLHLAVTRQFYV